MPLEDPDLEALARICRGEEQGLVDLMSRHRDPLFRFVYRFVRNQADAAELTEQTFLRVYEKAATFRPRAKVKTWMFAIAANLCRDFLRKSSRRPSSLSLDESVPGGGLLRFEKIEGTASSPVADSVTAEALKAIESAVDALPHKLKFPLIFCVLEDHSHEECAEVLHTNLKTVETRIYRARQHLRTELKYLREDS